GVVIQLSDDARASRARLAEMIAAVAIADEAAAPAQLIQCAGDLAPILAAEPLHDLGIEQRTRRERLLDRLEAGGTSEHPGRACRERNLARAAEGPGAVEAGLRARGPWSCPSCPERS